MSYTIKRYCIGEDGYREWYGTTDYESPFKMTYQEFINTTRGFSPEDMAMIFRGSYERTYNGAEERQELAGYWYLYYMGEMSKEELENIIETTIEGGGR